MDIKLPSFQIVKREKKFFIQKFTFFGWKDLKDLELEGHINFKTENEAKLYLTHYVLNNTSVIYPIKKVAVGRRYNC